MTKNANYYDEKYMKIKFNLADELHLNKKIEIPTITITIVVRAILKITNIMHEFS